MHPLPFGRVLHHCRSKKLDALLVAPAVHDVHSTLTVIAKVNVGVVVVRRIRDQVSHGGRKVHLPQEAYGQNRKCVCEPALHAGHKREMRSQLGVNTSLQLYLVIPGLVADVTICRGVIVFKDRVEQASVSERPVGPFPVH